MSDVSGLATGDFAVGAGMDAVASMWDGEIAWLHLVLASGKGGFSGRTRSVFLGNDPPGQVAAGDVDRDGTLDAVVTIPGADSVLVALGIANGDEAFTVVPYAAGTQPGDVALGDLNADGTPDVVVTNGFPGGVSVLLGKGGGALAAPTPVTLDGVPDGVQVADLNGDGKLDVVTAQPDRSAVSVLLGDGTGALAPAAQHPAGIGAAGVRVGDLDGDGRPDIVVLNSRLDGFSVLRNTTEPPRTAGARDTTIAVTSSLNPSRVGDAVVYGADHHPGARRRHRQLHRQRHGDSRLRRPSARQPLRRHLRRRRRAHRCRALLRICRVRDQRVRPPHPDRGASGRRDGRVDGRGATCRAAAADPHAERQHHG